ncbi:O-antigen ligase family protein [Thermocrinis minervae]|uniref:O-Antigen ligase n=1 Tax=Thermocrinis minervae TaxID=381751 RepID=A0A1M6S7T0_9AQUI|nr:O-antigen ligase family protein [Thermocrinis minervae]SHK40731.1 hypothetical protein SAMN05444391_0914 [Thermocrinis minervae]
MIYLLLVSAFVSISLFEGLVLIVLLYTAYLMLKGEIRPKGILGLPLVMYSVPSFASSVAYYPGKAIERSFFLLSYFYGQRLQGRRELLLRINYTLLAFGFLLIPVLLWKHYTKGEISLLWGGPFEVSNFYSLFFLASLSLLLYKKRPVYVIPAMLFLVVVFFSQRRSTLIGLVLALFMLLWLYRHKLSKRSMLGVTFGVLSLILLLGVFFYYKDPRIRVVFEKGISLETLDEFSSKRLYNLRSGLMVIRDDFKEKNLFAILFGHGINPAERLPYPSVVGGYESVFVVSEFTERGLLGLLGVLWFMFAYFRRLLVYRLDDPLKIPFLLMLCVHLGGIVFTGFWDAMLPLYLIMFRMVEDGS